MKKSRAWRSSIVFTLVISVFNSALATTKSKTIENLTDPEGLGVPTVYTLTRGPKKIRFQKTFAGQFTEVEITEYQKLGVKTQVFRLSANKKRYLPVLINFEPAKTYKAERNCTETPLTGAISAINRVNQMAVVKKKAKELKAKGFFDKSCDEFGDDAEALYEGVASAFVESSGAANGYLNCLNDHGLATEAQELRSRLQPGIKDQSLFKPLTCDPELHSRATIQTGNPLSIALKVDPAFTPAEYFGAFAHERLHECGVNSHSVLEPVESCCIIGNPVGCQKLEAVLRSKKEEPQMCRAKESPVQSMWRSELTAMTGDASFSKADEDSGFRSRDSVPAVCAIDPSKCSSQVSTTRLQLSNSCQCRRDISSRRTGFVATAYATSDCGDISQDLIIGATPGSIRRHESVSTILSSSTSNAGNAANRTTPDNQTLSMAQAMEIGTGMSPVNWRGPIPEAEPSLAIMAASTGTESSGRSPAGVTVDEAGSVSATVAGIPAGEERIRPMSLESTAEPSRSPASVNTRLASLVRPERAKSPGTQIANQVDQADMRIRLLLTPTEIDKRSISREDALKLSEKSADPRVAVIGDGKSLKYVDTAGLDVGISNPFINAPVQLGKAAKQYFQRQLASLADNGALGVGGTGKPLGGPSNAPGPQQASQGIAIPWHNGEKLKFTDRSDFMNYLVNTDFGALRFEDEGVRDALKKYRIQVQYGKTKYGELKKPLQTCRLQAQTNLLNCR